MSPDLQRNLLLSAVGTESSLATTPCPPPSSRCTYPQCGTLHRALAWPCGWLARRTAVTVASYLASNPDLLLLHDTIAVLDNNKGLPEPSAKVGTSTCTTYTNTYTCTSYTCICTCTCTCTCMCTCTCICTYT